MAEKRAERAGKAVQGAGRRVTGAAGKGAGAAKNAGTGAAGAAKDAGAGAAGAAKDTGQGVLGAAKEAGQGVMESLPMGKLGDAAQNLLHAAAGRALSGAEDKLKGLTGRLTDYADNGGSSLLGAVTGSDKPGGVVSGALMGGLKGMVSKITGGKGGKGGQDKFTNIVETIDVGAPRRLVYNQWTLLQDFPTFMKKVENVKQESDEVSTWKAQVFWSHRNWKAHVREQIPDQRIIWRSEGTKGYVDGAVTFHALTDDLTRILVVLEYHPQGLFERTGNLWRAQGRRVRLELKLFRRHVMSRLLLDPDQVGDGWRGEIRDGEVVKDHETAMEEEERAEQGEDEDEDEEDYDEDEYEPEKDEYEEQDEEPDEDEEEYEEPEEDEYEDEEDYEEGEEPDEEDYEDEEEPEEEDEEEEEPEPAPAPRRRSPRAGRS